MKRIFSRAASAVTAGVMLFAITIPAGAADSYFTVNGGIYVLTDTTFTVGAGEEYILGFDDDSMNLPGGAPVDGDFYNAIEQNGDLWYAVDSVAVTFTLEPASQASDASHAASHAYSPTYVQGVFQLGDSSGWAWADSTNQPEFVTIEPDVSDGFSVGGEYVLTYYPKTFMESSGVFKDEQGGVCLMGLKVGNYGETPLEYRIRFTNLLICGETDKITEYSAVADEIALQEAKLDDGKIIADMPPLQEEAVLTLPEQNPSTGVKEVLGFTGWALISAGAMILSKKHKASGIAKKIQKINKKR